MNVPHYDPGHQGKIDVDQLNIFLAGLEPEKVLDPGEYCILYRLGGLDMCIGNLASFRIVFKISLFITKNGSKHFISCCPQTVVKFV